MKDDLYDYEDRNWELNRRLERDEEREPGAFRRRGFTFFAKQISPPTLSSRVVRTSKRGGRYEPACVETDRGSLSHRVVQPTKRAVDNSAIVDGKKALRSNVGSSQRCAILRREA